MGFHVLPASFLDGDPVEVDLVGCGGNGSQMLTGLARLDRAMRALGHAGLRVTAFDPDTVTAANVGRQLFAPADVGINKAIALVHRVNAFFGLAWRAEPQRWSSEYRRSNMVVTCVDTRAARIAVDREAQGGPPPRYWLDLGNREADGQVVLGEWVGRTRPARAAAIEGQVVDRLPTVLELFPEIRATKDTDDAAPSCSLAEALGRQELFINQAVATLALELLWRLFRFGRIEWHGAFVNLASGRVQPLPVDPEVWGRMGINPKRRTS
jgi:PRTRC genetic system ThiF family protein